VQSSGFDEPWRVREMLRKWFRGKSVNRLSEVSLNLLLVLNRDLQDNSLVRNCEGR
jgi:hypothetical protein